MKSIEINNSHIAYRHRQGLGRTIVFANSLGSDQSIWDEVIAALPTGYGILTYDLRGHGLSGGLADSIEGLADDVSQLIDALGIRDVLFCGVSIGGMIGQVLSAKRPDVVKASVLCNTAFKIGTAERWAERIDAIEKNGTSGTAELIIDNWFGPDYAEQSQRLPMHRAMVSSTADEAYLAACRAIQVADLSEYARLIEVPVICVGGGYDKSVPVSAVEALADMIPKGVSEIFPRLGHLPCLEMPERLAELIQSIDPTLTNLQRAGSEIRRCVLGDEHVDFAAANTNELDESFQTLITESAWGRVWANPGISARERSMITLALLAALGNLEEIPMHVRATAKTGATVREISEAFQHVAIYAGVPRANQALKLAKQTLSEMRSGKND